MFVLRSYSGKRMVFSEITILILFLVFGMVFEFRETGTIFYSESSQSKSRDHLTGKSFGFCLYAYFDVATLQR